VFYLCYLNLLHTCNVGVISKLFWKGVLGVTRRRVYACMQRQYLTRLDENGGEFEVLEVLNLTRILGWLTRIDFKVLLLFAE
jgi:hypothetical protein